MWIQDDRQQWHKVKLQLIKKHDFLTFYWHETLNENDWQQ